LGIFRLEHGLIGEIVDNFIELTSSGRKIPKGSTILLSSVTSLAAIGPASYAERVSTEAKRLSDSLSGEMMVVPAPPILWGGCDDPGTIRGVFDVNSWLAGLPGYPMKAAAQTVLSDLRGGTAAVQAVYNNRLVLPASLAFRSFQSFVIKGPADLCSGVGPLSVERESQFIHALIADLNKNMCLNIDPLPDLNRDTELLAVSPPLIIVGGSHASRMASFMDDRLPSFTRGGWRVGKTAVEGLAQDLAEAKESFPCEAVAVLQLFDNISYYTITSEDTIIPYRKDVTGRYHVDGDLLMAHRR
jgi:hypothetical protein